MPPLLLGMRLRLANAIKKESNSLQSAGILQAISIGIKENISYEDWQLFKKTGTSHLVAISGLHVGLIAGFSYWIMAFLWRCSHYLCLLFPAQRAASFITFFLTLFYGVLSGLAIPTQRALITTSVFYWLGDLIFQLLFGKATFFHCY